MGNSRGQTRGPIRHPCGLLEVVQSSARSVHRDSPSSPHLSTGVNAFPQVSASACCTGVSRARPVRPPSSTPSRATLEQPLEGDLEEGLEEALEGRLEPPAVAGPASRTTRAPAVELPGHEKGRAKIYRLERCLMRAVSSWTWSYTFRRSVISLRIFLSAYMTVVWSRPNV
jgi:hypothetical protein